MLAAPLLLLLAACGSARETTDRDAEVPRITGRPVPGTEAEATVTTPAPAAPTRTSPTVAPTAPRATRPLPTSLTTVAPTAPPATRPPAAPTRPATTRPAATSPPTVAPSAPPATGPLPTSLTTTTTIAVTPGAPVGCAGSDIATATGVTVGGDVVCHAGWAAANRDACGDPSSACDTADVFHVNRGGWVHDGRFDAFSPCDFGDSPLAAAGMSLATAEVLLGPCATATPVDPVIVRPGTSGPAVVGVQVALVGQGYPINADGTYGPRTEAAVRDFQRRNGLEVDGISGPATQQALGIAPPPAGPAPTTAPSATTRPPTTAGAPTSTGPTTTIGGIGPREPRACTAEAIGTDIGRVVTSSIECRAGWAVGVRAGCSGAACNTVDLYQQASIGWVLIGAFDADCAEGLMRSGMAPRVAATFADPCSTELAARTNITPGSSGSMVANLQIALVAQGYVIGTDGTFGPRTEQAVRDWQQRNGLEVDGIAGPATQESLGM